MTPVRSMSRTAAERTDPRRWHNRKYIFLLYLAPAITFYQLFSPWSLTNALLVPAMQTSFSLGALAFHLHTELKDPSNPLQIYQDDESFQYLAFILICHVWKLRAGREPPSLEEWKTRRPHLQSERRIAHIPVKARRELSRSLVYDMLELCARVESSDVHDVVATAYEKDSRQLTSPTPVGILETWWLGQKIKTRVVLAAQEMDRAAHGFRDIDVELYM